LLNKIANFFAPVMIVLFIALLIYGIPVFKHIYRNVDLSAQAPLSEVEWKVNEVNDEKYTLSVDYAFDVEGKHYSGSEEWQ
jgi:K+ transporter